MHSTSETKFEQFEAWIELEPQSPMLAVPQSKNPTLDELEVLLLQAKSNVHASQMQSLQL